MDSDLAHHLKACQEDYQLVYGRPFEHFFCPILRRDEDVPLQKGHVVNEALKSGRTWVPQRQDVDNFYGAVVEADLVSIIEGREKGAFGVWLDSAARRRHQPKLLLKGQLLEHYFTGPKFKTPPGHTAAALVSGGKTLANFAVKECEEILRQATDGDLELRLEGDFRPSVVAALLKAAHLSLFRIMGYGHVCSAGGLFLADILATFFEQNHGCHAQAKAALEDHFMPYQQMVAPLIVQDEQAFVGSVRDKLFLTCWTSRDEIFALGVAIKAGPDRFCVFVPTDQAIDTYFSFLNVPPPSLRVRYAMFRRPKEDFGGDWQIQTVDRRIPLNQGV